MMVEPLDFGRLRRIPLDKRPSLFSMEQASHPSPLTDDVLQFLHSLPRVHTVNDMRALAKAVVETKKRGGSVLFMFGAHLIKCGLTPILADLMRRGFVNALATHGASCVHDIELALSGKTSEDVGAAIKDGSFGMVEETGKLFAEVVDEALKWGGLGEALGERLLLSRYPQNSLFAEARRLGIPTFVHIAVGTDIVHLEPSLDGGKLGAASYVDFRRLAGFICRIDSGVVINFGSAVLMPEVFLKALSASRNATGKPRRFTAANFDQIPHYRPTRNILERTGATSYYIAGRHEFMLPLLRLFLLAEEAGWRVS